jgi:hypothetical protein
VATDATKKLKEPVAYLLLAYAGLVALGSLIGLFVGDSFSDAANTVPANVSDAGVTALVIMGALVAAVWLVTQTGERTPNARLVTLGALIVTGVVTLISVIGTFASFAGSLDASTKVLRFIWAVGGLALLGGVALFVLKTFQDLPKPVKALPAGPHGQFAGQPPGQQFPQGQQQFPGQPAQYGDQYGAAQGQYGDQYGAAQGQFGQQPQYGQYGEPQGHYDAGQAHYGDAGQAQYGEPQAQYGDQAGQGHYGDPQAQAGQPGEAAGQYGGYGVTPAGGYEAAGQPQPDAGVPSWGGQQYDAAKSGDDAAKGADEPAATGWSAEGQQWGEQAADQGHADQGHADQGHADQGHADQAQQWGGQSDPWPPAQEPQAQEPQPSDAWGQQPQQGWGEQQSTPSWDKPAGESPAWPDQAAEPAADPDATVIERPQETEPKKDDGQQGWWSQPQ